MLKIKRKLSQEGFSLIELMVAIVILALAIFGIFQAYSTGFMGMADARDRTVAVNYIQKTLEDYKNTPFKKIKDKSMSIIPGTKFFTASTIIDMGETEGDTHLKKVITQVRWPDRNGNIKIEENSMLIYEAPKTGDILAPSDIIIYASTYYRILPYTSTELTAEIHDKNGNIVSNWKGNIIFTITSSSPIGGLTPSHETTVTKGTSNGSASLTYYSYTEETGVETIQAEADLDGNTTIDVSDTVDIQITIGAEGIVLVPLKDSSSIGTSVNISLYVVDASFDYEDPSHIIGYDGPITLSASGPGTLFPTTVNAPDGTASFEVNSNGTPGTVEITASASDLDLGYTEVIFTGGAQSIQLTPISGSIYEGESIEITITILDENSNPTPFVGDVTITTDSVGSFTLENPIGFDGVSFRKVGFSHNVATVESIEINATGDGGLTSNTIYIDVLKSLTPSYIKLTAAPSNIKADDSDFSIVKATIYDDSIPSEIVTNYNGTIYFYTTLLGSHINPDFVSLSSDDGGVCHVNLYSTVSGDTNITAEGILGSTTINNQEPNPVVYFYSVASGLRVSSSKDTVVANGIDFTEITVEIIDNSVPEPFVVLDYSGDISLSNSKGYFEGETVPGTINLNFINEGSKSIKLYSYGIFGDATITAEANETDAGFIATASTIVTFTEPQEKNITYVENSVESFNHYTLIKFDIQVTGGDVDLGSMLISWLADTDLDKIEIMSPKSSGNYEPFKNTGGVSSPYTYENINTPLYYAEPGLSTIRLTFSDNNKMKKQNINIIFYEDETHYYPIQVYVPQ